MIQENNNPQEIEQLYMDYLQAARILQKDSAKQVLPYLILGGVFMCGGLSSILWAGYRTMVNLIFWGIVLSLVIEVVGIFVQTKWQNEESARIAQTKPGFVQFFKLCRQWRWPKQMVTGKKYEQFVTLLATPGSPAPIPPFKASSQRELSPNQIIELSEEEKQVLCLIAEDKHNPEIADRLGISPVQASLTTSELLKKFRVDGKAELINQARQEGYLPPN